MAGRRCEGVLAIVLVDFEIDSHTSVLGSRSMVGGVDRVDHVDHVDDFVHVTHVTHVIQIVDRAAFLPGFIRCIHALMRSCMNLRTEVRSTGVYEFEAQARRSRDPSRTAGMGNRRSDEG
jgi:hypothetical protein